MTRQTLNRSLQHSSTSHSLSSGILQRKCDTCGQHTIAGGTCNKCQQESSTAPQRKSSIGQKKKTSAVPSVVYEVLKSPGQPLDLGTRTFMESRFNHDFSHVRIHTDKNSSKTEESAQAINSKAYTVGQNIVFGKGQFAPNTTRGKHLLAHELAHVVQQSSNSHVSVESLEITSPSSSLEREADLTSHNALSGKPVSKGIISSPPIVARGLLDNFSSLLSDEEDEVDILDERSLSEKLEEQDETQDRLRSYGTIPVVPEVNIATHARSEFAKKVLPKSTTEAQALIMKLDDTLMIKAFLKELENLKPRNEQERQKIINLTAMLGLRLGEIERQADTQLRIERRKEEYRKIEIKVQRLERKISQIKAIKNEGEKREQARRLIEGISPKNLNQIASIDAGRKLLGELGQILSIATKTQTFAQGTAAFLPSPEDVAFLMDPYKNLRETLLVEKLGFSQSTSDIVGDATTLGLGSTGRKLIESLPEEAKNVEKFAAFITGEAEESEALSKLSSAIVQQSTSVSITIPATSNLRTLQADVDEETGEIILHSGRGFVDIKAEQNLKNRLLGSGIRVQSTDLVAIEFVDVEEDGNTPKGTIVPAFQLRHLIDQEGVASVKFGIKLGTAVEGGLGVASVLAKGYRTGKFSQDLIELLRGKNTGNALEVASDVGKAEGRALRGSRTGEVAEALPNSKAKDTLNLTPDELVDELEYAFREGLITGQPGKRTAKIGKHTWQETPLGWCRSSGTGCVLFSEIEQGKVIVHPAELLVDDVIEDGGVRIQTPGDPQPRVPKSLSGDTKIRFSGSQLAPELEPPPADQGSWYKLGDLDEFNRPTLAEAVINPRDLSPGSRPSTPQNHPAGVELSIGYDMTHLGAHELGFPTRQGRSLKGDSLEYNSGAAEHRNLTMASRQTNRFVGHRDTRPPSMREVEMKVRDAVRKGQTVHYRVTPIYDGSAPYPSAFHMQARGADPDGINIDTVVRNWTHHPD